MPSSVHVVTVTTKEDSIAKATAAAGRQKKSARALARNTRIDHPTPHLVHHQRRSFTAAIIPITILGRIQETEDEGCRL